VSGCNPQRRGCVEEPSCRQALDGRAGGRGSWPGLTESPCARRRGPRYLFATLQPTPVTDTTPGVAREQIEFYRRLDGSARLKLAFEISTLARDLALARLRGHHPDWPIDCLHRELLRYSLAPAPLPPALE
jgi:hypothetical protein